MSLLQYGFRRVIQEIRPTADHMSTIEEAGLGNVEYRQVSTAVTEITDLSPAKRRARGNYIVYSAEQPATIGKYAQENGNENARKHFTRLLPNLKESTIRNFKKAYKEKLEHQRKQQCLEPVTKLPLKSRGRPPLLHKLDEKLVKFLQAVMHKGGVVNIHVVRAATEALIKSNPMSAAHFQNFSMPQTWVQSLYRRMGYTKRTGTTTRPPVPKGLYDERRRDYLGAPIDRKMKQYNIPPELDSDQTPSS